MNLLVIMEDFNRIYHKYSINSAFLQEKLVIFFKKVEKSVFFLKKDETFTRNERVFSWILDLEYR